MVILFGRPQKIMASGTLLFTGVDGNGSVNFEYDNINASIIYSKISDSLLSTEIQGETGSIVIDKINNIKQITLNLRNGITKDLTHYNQNHNDYYYEISEFIDLIQKRKCESEINSHANSLTTIEIIDEIRRQIEVKFPADRVLFC
jgi:predicted dehydrogenase